jgi:hypothetical protein
MNKPTKYKDMEKQCVRVSQISVAESDCYTALPRPSIASISPSRPFIARSPPFPGDHGPGTHPAPIWFSRTSISGAALS